MCKKLTYLVSFVLMLIVVATAAGQSGTGLRGEYYQRVPTAAWQKRWRQAGQYGKWKSQHTSRIMKVMNIDEGLIREIVRRVLGVVEADRVILFGSAAAGQMTRDSDIDLLVVAPGPSNTIEERVKLLRALRGLGFSFDVFMIKTEHFEETKNIFGGIAYPAHKYGRVIYEAA